MTQADLLYQAFTIELPMTRRTLEGVRADLADYRPHPKSMPMGRLAMHVATLPGLISLILSTPSCDISTRPTPNLNFSSNEELLETFNTAASGAQELLRSATDADLGQAWKFSWQDRIISNEPRGVTILHMGLGHLSHHRAQLGTYLRLNDLPVPPVYGPSADQSINSR